MVSLSPSAQAPVPRLTVTSSVYFYQIFFFFFLQKQLCKVPMQKAQGRHGTVWASGVLGSPRQLAAEQKEGSLAPGPKSWSPASGSMRHHCLLACSGRHVSSVSPRGHRVPGPSSCWGLCGRILPGLLVLPAVAGNPWSASPWTRTHPTSASMSTWPFPLFVRVGVSPLLWGHQ